MGENQRLRSSSPVVVAALLTACCPLYIGYWFTSMYLRHGATVFQSLAIGASAWIHALLLIAGAVAYWRLASARPFLQIIAAMLGVYGLVLWLPFHRNVTSWNGFHGDIVAISAWEMIGFMVIGVLAVVDFALGRTHRTGLSS